MTAPSQIGQEPLGDEAPHRPAWREVLLMLAAVLVLVLLIKALLLQAFSIPSGSMQHTLEVGDRVLVNKLLYDVRGIHRGEVVVFDGSADWGSDAEVSEPRGGLAGALHGVGTFFGVATDDKHYIKRVIGLPGDRVMCCSPSGKVVVQAPGGVPVELQETYLLNADDDQDTSKWFCEAGNDRASCPPGSPGLLVPEGRLWMMGDHRGGSSDSRAYYTAPHQGTIPVDRVVGRAFAVVYPVSRWDVLTVPSTFTAALAQPAAPYLLGTLLVVPVAVLHRRRKPGA